EQAIESALGQVGDFYHEIIISDDGSTDDTPRIIDKYVRKYERQIRNISRGKNYGVSENYQHSISEAEGQYISILEGDDIWTHPEKSVRQAQFLQQNASASIVFSRLKY